MATEPKTLLDKVLSNFQAILGRVKYQVLFDLADFVTFLIVFFCGWIISLVGKKIVRKILNNFKIERHIHSLGLDDALGGFRFSDILENVTMWYILLLILQLTTSGLRLGAISYLLSLAYSILPGLFLLIILLSIGLLAGEYVSKEIKRLEFQYRDHVALLAKVFVIYLSISLSIPRLGIGLVLMNNVLIVILVALIMVLLVAFIYDVLHKEPREYTEKTKSVKELGLKKRREFSEEETQE